MPRNCCANRTVMPARTPQPPLVVPRISCPARKKVFGGGRGPRVHRQRHRASRITTRTNRAEGLVPIHPSSPRRGAAGGLGRGAFRC